MEYEASNVFGVIDRCMSTFVSALTSLLMSAMPESPVFLAKMGQKDLAKQSLEWLRGGDDGIGLFGEMEEIENNCSRERQLKRVSLRQLFAEPQYRRPTLIMMGLFTFRQLNGNMAVGFYLTEIFDQASTGLDPGLQATLVSLVQVCNRKYEVVIGPETNKSYR